jgi:hypothetical protein
MRVEAALVGVALSIAASSARAEEPKTNVEWKRDDAVVVAGATSLAGFYVMSMFAAEIADAVCNGTCTDRSSLFLLIPIAGPAIAAAMPAVQRLNPAWSVILVADSIAQLSSGLVALFAHFVPTKRVVVVPTLGGLGISAAF